jgi:hypothetical protein
MFFAKKGGGTGRITDLWYLGPLKSIEGTDSMDLGVIEVLSIGSYSTAYQFSILIDSLYFYSLYFIIIKGGSCPRGHPKSSTAF